MSSYTMQLREYIEMWSQNESLSTKDKIERGRTKLFDFDYPLFDINYKKVFETHFIRKFYMREIGFETEGLFKFNLESWLMINMPYFNKLFESELIQFDPLSNTKLNVNQNKTNSKTETEQRDSKLNSSTEGNNQSSSNQDSNGSLTENNFDRQLESNTPDSRLTITTNDGSGVIEYASQINENKANNSKTNSNNVTGTSEDTTSVSSDSTQSDQKETSINETDEYIESRIGKVGDQSFSKMLNEYRDTFLRIENKIFDEMQELFMLVY